MSSNLRGQGKLWLVWGLCGVIVLSWGHFSAALELGEDEEIHLLKGDLETIKTTNLQRVSVSEPTIADIANLDAEYVLLVAKKAGTCNVFLWDDQGKRTYVVRVFEDNLELVKARFENVLSKAKIEGVELTVNEEEGKVMAVGQLDKEKVKEYDKVSEPFSSFLFDLVKEKEQKDLIQIDAQLAEVSSSYTKKLGIDWTAGSALIYSETVPGINIDKPWDAFKLGEFQRSSNIEGLLNALITEGKARVLSRPKIVVVSGQEANIQVGGEIPVTTRTLTQDNILESIIYQEYGVNMKVTPTIKDDDRIDIKLSIDISDIDATSPVKAQVSFTNRVAQTQLFLENRQTIIMAGLIKHNEGVNTTRVPFLSDIPIFGAIFRNKSVSPDTELELVITLTPTIIKHKKAEKKEVYEGTKTTIAQPAQENRVASRSPQAPRSGRAMPQAIVTKGAMTTGEYFPEEMVPYVQMLQEQIAENVGYPENARQEGLEGTVKLNLVVLNDGTLAYATVRETSGFKMFDDNALDTAKRLSPYSAFPPETDLHEINVMVPIVYSLE